MVGRVIHIEINRKEVGKFKLLGVTWIDSLGIAPFEIDVEVDPSTDNFFAKTIFRIGMLDEHGRPPLSHPDCSANLLLEKRPRSDREWAMAVELTPPDLGDRTIR